MSGFDIWTAVAAFTGRDDFSTAVDGDEITPETLEIIWPDDDVPEVDKTALWEAIEAARTEALYAAAREALRDAAEGARQALIGGATATEVASWPNKAARARRFLDGNADAGDETALRLEAGSRGQAPEDLARLQLEKETLYAAAVARIDGWRHAADIAVEAADKESLDALVAAQKALLAE